MNLYTRDAIILAGAASFTTCFCKECTIRIKNLDCMGGPVADINPAGIINLAISVI